MRYIFSILFFFGIITVYAQDTIVLKEITVEDNYTKNINKIIVDSITQQIHHQNSLGDLLSYEPGIILKNQGSGGIQTVSIMGTHNQHSQILWFGMPLNESLNGQFDYSQLHISSIHSTSLYYGISSIQQFTGSLGGLICIENQQLDSIKPHSTIFLRYESLKNKTIYLDHITKIKKIITIHSIRYETGEQEFDFINTALLPTLVCTSKTPFTSFSYQNNSQYKWNKTTYQLNVELSEHHRTFAPLMTSYFKAEHNENQDNKAIKTVLNANRIIRKWNVEALVGARINNMNYTLQHTIFNNVVSSISSASKENSLFFSVNANKQLARKIKTNTYFNFNQEYGQFLDLKYNMGFCKTRYQSNVNQSFQLYWNKFFRQNIIINAHIMANQINVLPALISSIHLSNNVTIYYSVGYNQRIPSLNELYFTPGGNKHLLPEKSFQNDITLKFNFLKNTAQSLTFIIKPYFSQIKNWILWTPSQFGYWEANNIRQVKLIGNICQADYRYQISKNKQFIIDVNYTYQYINGNDGEYTVKHNPYIPSHTINAYFYYVYKNIHLYSEIQYYSTRYSLTYEDNYALDPYALYNLGLNYTFLKKTTLSIDFKVNNLTDKFYQSIIWRPMPGRYFVLSLKCNI